MRGASSDDPADRLGEVLVRLGYVERAKVEEVLREQPPSKVGRALVERGCLQAHDLFKCVTHQVSEIFHAIVLCREGAFFLIDQPVDDKTAHTIQLSTQSLLMDSIRKIDELAHFRKRIPHGRMYVAKKRPSDGKLEADEDRVLAMLDGRRTVLELGHAAKLSEFDITKVVFRLLEGGYAVALRQAAARRWPRPPEKAAAPTPSRPAGRRQRRRVDAPRGGPRLQPHLPGDPRRGGPARAWTASSSPRPTRRSPGRRCRPRRCWRGCRSAPDGTLPEPKLMEAFERHRAQPGQPSRWPPSSRRSAT